MQLNEIAEIRTKSGSGATPAAGAKSPPGDWGGADDRALRLFQAGRLNDAAIELALDSRDDNFVIAALALRSQVAQVTVERIIKTQSASLVIAICWKGGFTMRFALDIQKRPAQIQPAKLINARDGFDYPFTEDEINEQNRMLNA